MKIKKNGFTLIELLATVIILGVLGSIALISFRSIYKRNRNNYYLSQEKMLMLSAKNYVNDHPNILPRNVGGLYSVSAKTLHDNKYVSKITAYNKKSCELDKSYVRINKVSNSKYNYEVFLSCLSDDYQTGQINNGKDTINIFYEFTMANSESPDNKSVKKVKINLDDVDKKIGIASYEYRIVSSTFNKEAYSSRNIKLSKNTFNYEKKIVLSDVLNKSGRYYIITNVYDGHGNSYTKKSNIFEYNIDISCGDHFTVDGVNYYSVTENAEYNDPNSIGWTKEDRTVSVYCIGSSCSKSSFSKTFDSGSNNTSYVEIKSKSGSTVKCPVTVKVDKVPPKCETKSYVSDKDDNFTIDDKFKYNSEWTNKSVKVVSSCIEDTKNGSGCSGDYIADRDTTIRHDFNDKISGSESVEDSVGNYTKCKKVSVKIDKTAPMIDQGFLNSISKDSDKSQFQLKSYASCKDSNSTKVSIDGNTNSIFKIELSQLDNIKVLDQIVKNSTSGIKNVKIVFGPLFKNFYSHATLPCTDCFAGYGSGDARVNNFFKFYSFDVENPKIKLLTDVNGTISPNWNTTEEPYDLGYSLPNVNINEYNVLDYKGYKFSLKSNDSNNNVLLATSTKPSMYAKDSGITGEFNMCGMLSFAIQASDNAGNWTEYLLYDYNEEDIKCGESTYNKDQNTYVSTSDMKWTKEDRTVSVNCIGSSCSNSSFSKTFDSGSNYTSYVEIESKSGSTVKCPVLVFVDKDKPTLSDFKYTYYVASSNLNSSPIEYHDYREWYNKDVKVVTTASDAHSGFDHLEYRIASKELTAPFDDSSKVIKSYSAKFEMKFSSESINYLYVRAFDKAGNISDTKKTVIRIDKTAPIVNSDLNASVSNIIKEKRFNLILSDKTIYSKYLSDFNKNRQIEILGDSNLGTAKSRKATFKFYNLGGMDPSTNGISSGIDYIDIQINPTFYHYVVPNKDKTNGVYDNLTGKKKFVYHFNINGTNKNISGCKSGLSDANERYQCRTAADEYGNALGFGKYFIVNTRKTYTYKNKDGAQVTDSNCYPLIKAGTDGYYDYIKNKTDSLTSTDNRDNNNYIIQCMDFSSSYGSWRLFNYGDDDLRLDSSVDDKTGNKNISYDFIFYYTIYDKAGNSVMAKSRDKYYDKYKKEVVLPGYGTGVKGSYRGFDPNDGY